MDGKIPKLALVVTVEEAFAHCTKCMVRSRLWQPQTWQPDGLFTIGSAIVTHGRLDMNVGDMEAIADENARTQLY